MGLLDSVSRSISGAVGEITGSGSAMRAAQKDADTARKKAEEEEKKRKAEQEQEKLKVEAKQMRGLKRKFGKSETLSDPSDNNTKLGT